jgi:hypothetical protein
MKSAIFQSYVNNQHMECKVMSGSLDSSYKEDMGMVRDGSKCGEQRICMNQTCLSLSTFQAMLCITTNKIRIRSF